MSFVASIRQLRSSAGLSQQAVADAVGLARATYIKLENGGREPKLGELTKISQYYEVSLQELVSGTVIAGGIYSKHKSYTGMAALDSAETLRVNDASAIYSPDDSQPFGGELGRAAAGTQASGEATQRDAVPQLQPRKLRQVLLYMLGRVGARPNVGETALHRLLYFIDFDYYEQTGKSITGLAYVHEVYGPAPTTALQSVVDDMQTHNELEVVETKNFSHKQKKYLPLKEAVLGNLTASEIKHIDAELERLAHKSATELSNLAYKDAPWVIAKRGQMIDYRDTFYRTEATSVIESNDEL